MKLFKPLENKQGVALILAVLFMLVFSTLLGGLFFASMTNLDNQETQTNHTSAYYVAESGVNITVAMVIEEITALVNGHPEYSETEFYSELDSYLSNLESSFSEDDYFDSSIGDVLASLDVTKNGNTYSFEIDGSINGVSRILSKSITFDYHDDGGNGFSINKAIWTTDGITLNGDVEVYAVPATDDEGNPIKAHIATHSTTNNDISFNRYFWQDPYVNGDIYLSDGTNENVVDADGSLYGDILNGNGGEDFLEDAVFPTIDFSEDGPIVTKFTSLSLSTLPNVNTSKFKITNGSIWSNSVGTSGGSAYTYNIPGGNYYVPKIELLTTYSCTWRRCTGEKGNLVINADSDVVIVTDQVNIEQNVTFTGSGVVEIYVRGNDSDSKKNFTLGNDSLGGYDVGFRMGNYIAPQNLVFYVSSDANTPTMEVKGGASMSASFMFDDMNIRLAAYSSLAGYVMTNGDSVEFEYGVDINEGQPALYYAPNAHVELNSGWFGTINYKGSIVAKSVSMSGNWISEVNIMYQKRELVTVPWVTNPIAGLGVTGAGFSITFDEAPLVEVD